MTETAEPTHATAPLEQQAAVAGAPTPTLAQLKTLDIRVDLVAVPGEVMHGLITLVRTLAAKLAEHEGDDARL